MMSLVRFWLAMTWAQRLWIVALLFFMGMGLGASLALLARAVLP